jgi:hypothetical protein
MTDMLESIEVRIPSYSVVRERKESFWRITIAVRNIRRMRSRHCISDGRGVDRQNKGMADVRSKDRGRDSEELCVIIAFNLDPLVDIEPPMNTRRPQKISFAATVRLSGIQPGEHSAFVDVAVSVYKIAKR